MAKRKKVSSRKVSKGTKTPRGTPRKTASPRKTARRGKRDKPQTMEELLAQAKTSIRSLSRGQKVKGKVVDISKKSVSVDIGGKSEGLVTERAFNETKGYIKSLKVGDKVTATVLIPETPDGFAILSFRHAQREAAWEKILKAKAKGELLVVLGHGVNPSGLTAEVQGLVGFIPNSQLGKEALRNRRSLIGKHFEARVLEADPGTNKIILSEKEVSEAGEIKLIKRAQAVIKEGKVYDGEVTKIYAFGCFVKINISLKKGEGLPAGRQVSVEGLVHISEMSWEKVDDPRDIVSEGDKVKVKLISKKDGKLSFSIKHGRKDPWEDASAKYKKDSRVKGKVAKVSDYGIFVQLEPGVGGLIHVTKIPPGTKLERGQEVEVYVEEIREEERKLSLGLVLTRKPVGYK